MSTCRGRASRPTRTSTTRPDFDATDPAAYRAAAWAPYDEIVRGLAARHMGIDLALAGPTAGLGRGPGRLQVRPQPVGLQAQRRPNIGQWVRAVATRYSGHYTPPGAAHAAAAGELLVGLERAEPRHLSRAADTTWQLLGRGLPAVVPRPRRRGLERPAGNRTRLGHDPDRRAGTGRLDLRRQGRPRRVRQHGRRCGSCARCTASTPTTSRCAGRRRRRAAVRRPRPRSKQFAAQNPGLFKASGFADHPYPQGLPPNTVDARRARLRRAGRDPEAASECSTASTVCTARRPVPDLVDRVRLRHRPAEHDRRRRSRSRPPRCTSTGPST